MSTVEVKIGKIQVDTRSIRRISFEGIVHKFRLPWAVKTEKPEINPNDFQNNPTPEYSDLYEDPIPVDEDFRFQYDD